MVPKSPGFRPCRALLLTVVVACLLTCDLYRSPYGPPVLLLHKDHRFLFSPVVSHDGRLVYYLEDSTFAGRVDPTNALHGDLRVFSLTDSSDRLLVAGSLSALALSRDGQRLAAICKEGRRTYDSTLFVLLDTGGVQVDTMSVCNKLEYEWSPWDLRFDPSGDSITFDVWTGTPNGHTYFLRFGVAGNTWPNVVGSVPWYCVGFDVFSDGRIYCDSVSMLYPSVNPVDDRWVVTGMSLRDLKGKRQRNLFLGIAPYQGATFIQWPRWTPDGRSIVFSAGEDNSGWNTFESIELWMLKDIVEFGERSQ